MMLRAEAEKVAETVDKRPGVPRCDCAGCRERRTRMADALIAFAERREKTARLKGQIKQVSKDIEAITEFGQMFVNTRQWVARDREQLRAELAALEKE